MTAPLVTVAVPTVSRPAMLRETLESVLAQTWPNLEVLLSDNGADPGTVEVFEALRDPRVRYRRNESTVPAPVHFNQCLAEARGEHFVILSDDDLVSPNFVEVLSSLMARHPDAVVALPRSETMGEDGRTLASLKAPEWEVRPGVELVLDWLWRRGPVPVSTFISALWRTSALRAAGGFPAFADGSNSENGALIAVACRGSAVFGEDALFRYRVYPASCGLSVPLERLALSAAQLRRHVVEDGPTRDALATLEPSQRRAVLRGVRRLLARQYLQRLETNYLPRIGYGGVLAALPAYGAEVEYLRALPRFLRKLAARALRRDAGGSQPMSLFKKRRREPGVDPKAFDQLRAEVGRLHAHRARSLPPGPLRAAEFKVFSQWGEDGIIQYLLGKVPVVNELFVEFGVESYSESNTRFLLCNDNWRGIIIDGGTAHQELAARMGLDLAARLTAPSRPSSRRRTSTG